MGTTTGCNNSSSGENQLQSHPSSLTALPHVNSSLPLPAHGATSSGGGVGGGMVCEEQYCLRWHDFQTNVTSAFSEIRDDEDLLDVTLVCPDGGMLRAHKLMLSACSPMFKAMLQRTPAHPQPVIFMHGVKRHSDVAAILNFMYRGEVNVGEGDIGSFLAIAEDLKVRGLTQEDLKDRLPPGLTATSPSSNKRKHDCSGSEGDDGEEEDMDPEPVRVKPEPGNSAETGSSVNNARKQHVVICKSTIESSDSQIHKKLFQQQQSHLHPCGNRGSAVKSEKVRRVS